jgi:hypothetical protein
MSDAFLNSVNPYLKKKQKEGRITAVVAKAGHHKAIKNQTQ